MGYDLTNKKGEFRLTIHFFPKLLRLALAYDWIPQGTLKIETTGWDGSYLKNSFQRVGALDALNLAGALERALEYGPEEAEILTREICKRKMSTGEALAFISAVRGLGKDKITGVVKKIIRLFNDNRITPDEAREVVHRIGEIIRVSETE